MDESQLIVRLRQEDNEAFRVLLKRYKQKVFAVVIGITGNYDAAVDLTQDVFVEVHRSIRRFRGDAKLSSWLYRIATNKALNFIRNQKKYKNNLSIQRGGGNDNYRPLEIIDEAATHGQHMMENSELAGKIQAAINHLTPNQKTAFILNKIDGMSYRQVAEIMNVSLAKVESLIFRARKALQNELREEANERISRV